MHAQGGSKTKSLLLLSSIYAVAVGSVLYELAVDSLMLTFGKIDEIVETSY